jgi:hypothetical protein
MASMERLVSRAVVKVDAYYVVESIYEHLASGIGAVMQVENMGLDPTQANGYLPPHLCQPTLEFDSYVAEPSD